MPVIRTILIHFRKRCLGLEYVECSPRILSNVLPHGEEHGRGDEAVLYDKGEEVGRGVADDLAHDGGAAAAEVVGQVDGAHAAHAHAAHAAHAAAVAVGGV